MRKSFRNGLLFTVLIASVIFLSAQVNQSSEVNQRDRSVENVADSLPKIDNSEGLVELNNIIKRYDGNSLFLSGEILLYENADSLSAPEEKVPFTTILASGTSSFEIDSVQTIVNENLTLQIDKKERTIAVIEKNLENEIQTPTKDMASQLEELKNYIYTAKVSYEGNNKILRIQFTEEAPSNVVLYEIIYEPNTYQVKKVRMQIPDGELSDSIDGQSEEDELVIVDENKNEMETGYYADVKVNVYEWVYKIEKKADLQVLNLSRFVTKANDMYVPSGNFKNYEILN